MRVLADKIQKLAVLTGFAITMGVAALGGSAIAAASSGGNVDVSPPGVIDSDGTQGSYAPAMQGQADDDGDQDAYLNNSWEATPQDKPHTK
jgi:hypothetical protein